MLPILQLSEKNLAAEAFDQAMVIDQNVSNSFKGMVGVIKLISHFHYKQVMREIERKPLTLALQFTVGPEWI